jgi:hypothetical protein
MAIEFSEIIKRGGGTMELGVLNPSSTGVVASVSTIGTAIDNTQWVKVGEGDTDWRQFLTGEEDGTFSANIELADVSDIIPPANVLGVKGDKPTIGDGLILGGRPIAMQSDLIQYTLIGNATNTVMTSATTLTTTEAALVTSPTSLHIGNGVTAIGDNAFHYNNYLTSLIIPDSVITIGNNAFSESYSLDSVIIGNGVTTIGDNAFDLTPIKSVIIPDSVITIGSNVFSDLESVTIGNSVETIGNNAFYYNPLESVTIPDSVITIGNNAFSENYSLTSVTIGNSVETIGDYAFYGCAFPSVTIPDSVIAIGDRAFYSNYSLTSVTIGNGVTAIGDNAFSDGFALNDVTANVTKTVFDTGSNILAATAGSLTLRVPTGDTTWDALEAASPSAYQGNAAVTVVRIP